MRKCPTLDPNHASMGRVSAGPHKGDLWLSDEVVPQIKSEGAIRAKTSLDWDRPANPKTNKERGRKVREKSRGV